MKIFFWKLRYALHFKSETFVDWSIAWSDAGASAEDPEILEISPIEAADESIEAWVQSQ
jgi:hypothetical protein